MSRSFPPPPVASGKQVCGCGGVEAALAPGALFGSLPPLTQTWGSGVDPLTTPGGTWGQKGRMREGL